LVATFFLFALVSMRVALRARDVEVPNLVGATVENASLTVANLGLALRIDPNQRPDERVPAGAVMQQDPAPGDVARRQRSIRVWVSSGPRRTTVPGRARARSGDRLRIPLTRLPCRCRRRAGSGAERSRATRVDAAQPR